MTDSPDLLDRRVLILAPTGRDAPAAAQLLREGELAAEICADLPALCRCLEQGAGAVLVAEEAFGLPGGERLFQWAQAQPPWSDFPFVVLTRPGSGAGAAEARL
ncbi:MAG TPA: sensor protein, partial [Acetobacteraceae bacterium]